MGNCGFAEYLLTPSNDLEEGIPKSVETFLVKNGRVLLLNIRDSLIGGLNIEVASK